MYDERFRNIEIKIGVLLFVILTATVFSLLYVGYKKDLFADRISYRIISPTGERLVKGMPVKFEGFRMGSVTALDLNDEGKIVLSVTILKKYQKWIKTDSIALFNQESLIGDPYLRFTAGSPSKPVMPDGGEFELYFEGGLDEIIRRAKPVMDDLEKSVRNLRVLTDALSSTEGDFQRFLASLRSMAEKLDRGEGGVPYLLTAKESRVKIEEILTKIDTMGASYNQLALDFQKAAAKADAMIVSIDTTMKSKVNPILDDVKKTTQDLYLMRRQGEYTLRLGSDLLLKMNNTWPFTPSGEEKKTPELPNP